MASSTSRTLVLMRHGKSDWSGAHADRDRPLAGRGTRQAAEAGRWLAAHGPGLALAVVSPALRARATWELAAAQLPSAPTVRLEEDAYCFDGDELLRLVRALADDEAAVALVGHDPALAELLATLTGEQLPMPTSCLAVLTWDGGWADAATTPAGLVAHGRPPGPGRR